MLYRKLGRSGLKVSVISVGSWQTFGQTVDDETTLACMSAAYDQGVNFFDSAECYGWGKAEEAMGRALKKLGWRRGTYILSSKVLPSGQATTCGGLSRKHLVDACDGALERMNVDYLDMFFCHRPDPDTPLDEIVHTMYELIMRGKILYWGTSEFSVAQILEMYAIARQHNLIPPTMEQTRYNMFHRARVERDLLPLFESYSMGATIFSPLAQGVLTGKYNNGIPEQSRIGGGSSFAQGELSEERLETVRGLGQIAEEVGVSMAQLALAWTLKNPNVSTAIIGATKPAHVTDNIAACEAVEKIEGAVVDRIEAMLKAPEITPVLL